MCYLKSSVLLEFCYLEAARYKTHSKESAKKHYLETHVTCCAVVKNRMFFALIYRRLMESCVNWRREWWRRVSGVRRERVGTV